MAAPLGSSKIRNNRSACMGNWLLFTGRITQLASICTLTSLKAAFVGLVPDESGWVVAISYTAGFALLSLYGVLLIITTAIMIRLWGSESGLRWDPDTLADQLSLIQGSNIIDIFKGLEYTGRFQCSAILRARRSTYGDFRLGYCKHHDTNEIWHGVSFVKLSGENGTKRKSIGETRNKDIVCQDTANQVSKEARESDSDISNMYTPTRLIGHNKHLIPMNHLPYYRYRVTSAVLCDTVLSSCFILLGGLIGCIIAGLAKHQIQGGMSSCFREWDKTDKHSSVNYQSWIFRFFPNLLVNVLSYLWFNADNHYRTAQPFAEMDRRTSQTGCLLLNYTTSMPISITIKAARNRHWRVALCSISSLVSTIIQPAVMTGVFVSTRTEEKFTISIAPANFWISFALLVISLLCILAVRPANEYRLPRDMIDIYDVWSLCYASRMLTDLGPDGNPILSAQNITDTKIHLESRIHLAKMNCKLDCIMGRTARGIWDSTLAREKLEDTL
ncbi:hypothetical protein EAF00_009436 [Botryotinia globosa]|nr:hypothetical protein EAF00_009436 [Botryotinia globosa]